MRNAMRRIQTSIFGIQRPERGQQMKLNFSKCEDKFDTKIDRFNSISRRCQDLVKSIVGWVGNSFVLTHL